MKPVDPTKNLKGSVQHRFKVGLSYPWWFSSVLQRFLFTFSFSNFFPSFYVPVFLCFSKIFSSKFMLIDNFQYFWQFSFKTINSVFLVDTIFVTFVSTLFSSSSTAVWSKFLGCKGILTFYIVMFILKLWIKFYIQGFRGTI